MKRMIAAVLAALMLAFMLTASASTPGSSADPLVTRSYLEGDFADALKSDISLTIGGAADSAIERLDDIFGMHAGHSFAPGFTAIPIAGGGSITLFMGGSFILLTGSATLTVSSGSVINVSTGSEAASGSPLTRNQRYFCTENTTAVITASSASTGQIDGYYFAGAGVPQPAPEPPLGQHSVFRDVMGSDWFFAAVDFVYENGLFAGMTHDSFEPGTMMSRAMFVTVLHRLDGLPEYGAGRVFYDVRDPAQYYYDAVMWASENGIVTGYDDRTFLPDRNVSREQMAVFMHRYTAYRDGDLSASGAAFEAFPDVRQVSGYAADALRWAVSKEVIRGSDGRLMPLEPATRAQVAQIFFNYSGNVG